MGQKAKYSSRVDVFRFDPESGLTFAIAPCPKSAKAGDTPLNARYVRTDSRECVARV
jgi:hypothetical protein